MTAFIGPPCESVMASPFIFCVFIDAASAEKERLEEKQRASRRERSKDEEEWSTRCVSSIEMKPLSDMHLIT